MNHVVLIPYFGGIDHEHLEAVKVIEQAGVPIIRLHNCPYVDHARAMMATMALETEHEVFVWIDHDIIFDPADVERLADGVLQGEADIVAGPYTTKRPGGKMVCNPMPDIKKMVFFEGGGYYPAQCVAMGFTAVHRRVFEKLAEDMPLVSCGHPQPCYPFFHHIVDAEAGLYLGEDYSFCRRATEAGFTITVDTRIRLYHKGFYSYSIEDCGIVVPNTPTLTVDLNSTEPPVVSPFRENGEHVPSEIRDSGGPGNGPGAAELEHDKQPPVALDNTDTTLPPL